MKIDDIKFNQLPYPDQAQIKKLLQHNEFRAAKVIYHAAQTKIYRRIKKRSALSAEAPA